MLRRIDEGVAVQTAQAHEFGVGQARESARKRGAVRDRSSWFESRRDCRASARDFPGAVAPPRRAACRCADRSSPTARMGPKASVSLPRSAISSIGMQPSNGTKRSKLWVGTRCGGDQRVDETIVLFSRQRQIEIVVAALAVTRGPIGDVHIDRLGGDDGRDRVVKIQMLFAQLRRQIAPTTPAKSAARWRE